MFSPLRVGIGAMTILCVSLFALGQTTPANKSKRVGFTKHTVAGNGLHLHHHQLITGNHSSAGQLRGIHSIGALQGKRTAQIHVNASNGRFHFTADGSRQGIRSVSLRTIKGQPNEHGRPHPKAGIFATSRVSADLPDAPDGTEYISLPIAADESGFTQLGGTNTVTVVMMFQIGNVNGQPVFASATLQMDLQRFLQLIGGQQNANPNPFQNQNQNPVPSPDPFPAPNPSPDPVPDPVPDPAPQV